MKFLFAWAIFAAAAGSFAKAKNRNVVLWVIIGLLIGPFALLVIGLMKPVPGGEDQGYD